MTILTVGIDLAKNVFAVHGRNEEGKPVLVRPAVPRARLLELIASLPPCLIGMEACSGAHHWARQFARFGHTVRKAAVALANKNARILWAVMTRGVAFDPHHLGTKPATAG